MINKNSSVVRVTMTVDYILPEKGESHLSAEELIKEWFFSEYSIDRTHAFRDSSRIGFSHKILSTEIMTLEKACPSKER